MLEPLDNETQPQFAIRFHEAMADEIADTSKRNRACFEAWDKARGDDPTISELVESRFTPDQYQRLHNVAMFHEHEVPEQLIGGKKVPAQHYGRDELAEMVEGMNDRILDHDEFSPITRGHSGPKPGDKSGERQMPEVLGFAGPYKLGMIGRKNPRWAIFGTEYHMKDAVPELKKRVGRSPEVWRYARMRDRFFYPIATLGEEMPRLNLPPAHYSRRSADSVPVFVECYSAVFPGGSNTFTPSFSNSDGRKPMQDQYSSDAPAGGGSGHANADLVQEIIEALFETQPFQFLFGLMRQSGDSGSPNPAVPNDIPPDPNAPAPGAPGAPGAQAPAAGPDAGQPAGGPAAAPPAGNPAAAQGAPPSSPAGNGGPPMPPSPQDPNKDKYSRDQFDVLQEQLTLQRNQNAELLTKLNAATARIAQIDAEKTKLDRYSRLEKLSNDFLLVPERELERTANYSPEQFDAHLEIIRDNYQRSLTNMPDFAAASDTSPAVPNGGPAKSGGSLDAADVKNIEKYCIDHDCTYSEGKEIYLRERSMAS